MFCSGFLVVKKYEKLYKDYADRYNLSTPIYAIPRIDKEPYENEIKYRWLDRDALGAYQYSDNLAEIRMAELEENQRSEDDFIFQLEDTMEVYDYLDNSKEDYEIIWTRIAEENEEIPEDFISAGFEPSYFYGDHFSASCDCMLIPRWHGTDNEGLLFQNYFKDLNQFGLFKTKERAQEFLNYYRSFDWTETGEYYIAEVFIKVQLKK